MSHTMMRRNAFIAAVLVAIPLLTTANVRAADESALLNIERKVTHGFVFTASPWAAGGMIFCLNEDGICCVLRAGDKFELLHTHKLAEDYMCMATPALAGDRLLIRTAARMYLLHSAPRASADSMP